MRSRLNTTMLNLPSTQNFERKIDKFNEEKTKLQILLVFLNLLCFYCQNKKITHLFYLGFVGNLYSCKNIFNNNLSLYYFQLQYFVLTKSQQLRIYRGTIPNRIMI